MDITIIFLGLGIFFGFFIQTMIGFAGAMVALPFLLMVMPLPDAVTYISIFYFISTPFYMYKEWKHIDQPLLKKLTFSSIIGLVLGIMLLIFGKPFILKTALGVFIILYVLYSLLNKKTIKPFYLAEYIFGFLGGFFSGIFSTGGPLYVIVVKNMTPDVRTFRATMFGVLGMVTLFRIPALIVGGALNTTHLINSLYILPFFILSLFLGKKLYLQLNENLLKKVILSLLFISGILLL